MPDDGRTILLIPCGGTTPNGLLMRKVVLRVLERDERVRVFDLGPFLAGSDVQSQALASVPPSGRVAISGCKDCCPRMVLKNRGIDIGHTITVDCSLNDEAAEKDLLEKIMDIIRCD